MRLLAIMLAFALAVFAGSRVCRAEGPKDLAGAFSGAAVTADAPAPEAKPVPDFFRSLDDAVARVFPTEAQADPVVRPEPPRPTASPEPYEWRTWDRNPDVEVYGRESGGTFLYTHMRYKSRPAEIFSAATPRRPPANPYVAAPAYSYAAPSPCSGGSCPRVRRW